MKKILICLHLCLFLILQSGCLTEEDLNTYYDGYVPEAIGDSWVISGPEAENMDSLILDQVYQDFFNEDRYPTAQGLLIVRHGKLLAEAYCKDAGDLMSLHNIKSATKSISSILTGIMLDIGAMESLESSVYDYLPEYFDDDFRKQDITLRHVLTMETGLAYDDDVHTREMLYNPGSSLKYVLDKDLVFDPGTDWYYGDGNPQLISGLIQKLTGKTASEFAEEYLFGPMGIDNYLWETTKDGLTLGAIGLWLTPRDMAKIGLLMARQGMWNGNRLVSESWIRESTTKQSLFSNYGYYWYPIEDKAFYAEGHGGQLIWVYPEFDLVVVIISYPYTKSWNLSEPYTGIFNGIIASLKDREH
jgi:CubicO group peptidase (beta-lactamase class C family)